MDAASLLLATRPHQVNPATFGEGGIADLRIIEGGSQAAVAWPAANLAIYIPIVIFERETVVGFAWSNGTITTAPTVDCGIYRPDGVRLINTGATTQAGASTVQTVSCTSTLLLPGRYLLAMLVSGTGSQFNEAAANSAGLAVCGVKQQAVGAATLPNPATFALISNSYVPILVAITQPGGQAVL